MKISIGIVAYNEEKYLPRLFLDLAAQTYPHKNIEIILTDSMSDDGTKECMKRFAEEKGEDFHNIEVIANPGRIQSCGWNEVLVHFSGDAVIRLDAHSHIPPDFVEKNAEVLKAGEMVCGGMRPALTDGDSKWKHTLLMAEESMFGSSISSFRRKAGCAYVKSFFHGAYRREVFEKAGGFREDLGRTEDNEMHYRIRENGFRLCMSPEILSYQYIRPDLRKMCKQKFGNGYWIGLTFGVCPGCLSLYHFVPCAFLAGIVLTTAAALCSIFWPALLMWIAYWGLALLMSIYAVKGEKKAASQILLPFLFFILHISYGVGTAVGLCHMPFWRGKHRNCQSVERVKEQMKYGRENA